MYEQSYWFGTVSAMRTDSTFFFDKWIGLTTTFELCLQTTEFIMITAIV